MAKIFVTRKIPGEHLEGMTKAGHEVSVSEFNRPISAEELVEKVKGVEAILSILTDRIDGDLMEWMRPGPS